MDEVVGELVGAIGDAAANLADAAADALAVVGGAASNAVNDALDDRIPVKIFNTSPHPLPQYQTAGASGMDLYANISPETNPTYKYDGEKFLVELEPGERVLIKTGIHVQLPPNYELQIRPRSGLALKHGITIVNTPGTIDDDYRGEIGVIALNTGSKAFLVKDGDRIAQMVLQYVPKMKLIPVVSEDDLSTSDRDSAGFGTTGR